MPFPEWGHSYNALCVPLKRGWQCALIPARDIEDVDRGWQLSYEARQQARMQREEQMEQDRRDFDQLFRVSMSRSAPRISGDYSAYVGFIGEHVRGGWHMPIDGEDITRILHEAVRDGLIVPVIDRNWRGSGGISKRYAPQVWPKRAPDPRPTVYASRNGRFYPMDPYGNVLDERYYAPVVAKAAASGSGADGSGGGVDWLSMIELANIAGGEDMTVKSVEDSDDRVSLLGDVPPFEYRPDTLDDADVFDLAKTPNDGEPGTWYTNPGSGQMRLFGETGAPVVDLDFDHVHSGLRPHAHNWNDGVRDGGDDVVPFSPWSP